MDTTYYIRFGRADGTLACQLAIGRASDQAAVRLAHSLARRPFVDVEVWRGEQRVHAARVAHRDLAAA